MTVAGRRLDFRCFLEGIEVPCITAGEQVNFDAPATCSIQCVPTPSSTRLKARTAVDVFYKDLTRTGPSAPYLLYFSGEIVGYTFSKTPNSLSIVYQAVDDSSYWDTAYQYFTDYGRGSDWLFKRKSSFMGSGVGLFDNLFREHASVIGGLLRTSPKTYPQLRGLAGGVVHVLEAVGGVQGRFRGFNDFFTMAELRRKILAQISASEADETSVKIYNHKVFWQWLMRNLGSAGSMVSIRDMIKLMFQYIFHNVVPNPIAKYEGAGKTDIRTRKYRLANTKKGKTLLKHLNLVQGLLSELRDSAADSLHTLAQAAEVLQEKYDKKSFKREGSYPAREIFLANKKVRAKHGAVKSGYQRALALGVKVELKKAREAAKGLASIAGSIEVIETLIKKANNIALKQAQASLLSDDLQKQIKSKGLLEANIFKQLVRMYWDGLTRPGDDISTIRSKLPKLPLPTRLDTGMFHIQKALLEIAILQNQLGGKVLTSKLDFTPRERLHTQIFRPDVWFVAPPRCNVFFPDDYIQFSYSRNFLQELTRMELTTAMELIGSNRITNSRYFSPNVQDITGKYTLQSSKSGVRLIMPHEVYTGILPKFEFMSEANIFAAKGDQKKAIRDQRKQLVEQQKFLREQTAKLRSGELELSNDQEVLQKYQDKVKQLEGRAKSLSRGGLPYIQRAVNFMFFKQRFASRAMSITANFTPRVVAGFPAAVIHRPPTGRDDKPSQFLGMVAGFSHSPSQQGGVTQVQFSQSREHDGTDDELMNIDGGARQNVTAGRNRSITINTATINATLRAKTERLEKLAAIKEQTASITSQKNRVIKEKKKLEKQVEFVVTYERRRKNKQKTTGFRGPNGGIISSVKPRNYKFQTKEQKDGTTVAAKGKIVGATLKALPTDLDYAEQYVVFEKSPSVTRIVNMPFEEQIYPSWLSPVYRNEQIGKDTLKGKKGVYQQFFGCKAITDDPGDTREARKEYEDALKDNDLTVVSTARPAKTIKEAVDEIVFAYDVIKRKGLNVRQFIDEYTRRPIATMDEIMGSPNLVLGEDGSVQQGRAGFRSFAYGDFDKLQGFDQTRKKIAAGKGKSAKVARGLDTRKKKREAVLKYRKELDKGQGHLGG